VVQTASRVPIARLSIDYLKPFQYVHRQWYVRKKRRSVERSGLGGIGHWRGNLVARRYWVAILAALAFRQATAAMARIATAAMPARYSQEAVLVPLVSLAASCAAVVKDDSSDH
jgi:hypothetical protein